MEQNRAKGAEDPSTLWVLWIRSQNHSLWHLHGHLHWHQFLSWTLLGLEAFELALQTWQQVRGQVKVNVANPLKSV